MRSGFGHSPPPTIPPEETFGRCSFNVKLRSDSVPTYPHQGRNSTNVLAERAGGRA